MLKLTGVAVIGLVIVIVLVIGLASDGPAANLFGGRKVGPLERKARELSAAVADHHAEVAEHRKFIAKPIACGNAARQAFDPATGKSVYYFYRWPSGTIECYTTGGFHSVTGKELEELSIDEVRVILGDSAKYPVDTNLWDSPDRVTPPRPSSSTPTPCPLTRPAPVATPLPELGQGPCCP